MSGTLSGNPQVSAAQWQARMTGQPASVTVNGQAYVVYPTGGIVQSGQLPNTTPNWWSRLTAPNSGVNQGLNIGTPTPGATTQVQSPLNQANPQTTYVSPQTTQPATAAPVTGSTGTQSGPSVAPTYNMPPAPDVATQARNYRAQHGLSDGSATDALNAESLAAARAGRTSFDPTLAAQYGQPMAAGVSGPRTDVVNALTMPTTAPTSVLATRQPIVLAPTYTQAYTPANAQQQSNSLLNQGLY